MLFWNRFQQEEVFLSRHSVLFETQKIISKNAVHSFTRMNLQKIKTEEQRILSFCFYLNIV
jgi:hypothetical protein